MSNKLGYGWGVGESSKSPGKSAIYIATIELADGDFVYGQFDFDIPDEDFDPETEDCDLWEWIYELAIEECYCREIDPPEWSENLANMKHPPFTTAAMKTV